MALNGTVLDPEAATLVAWARSAADSLCYLSDLDKHLDVKPMPERVHGHQWSDVDVAHARWAASTAISAVDLCAAALARRAGVGPVTRKNGAVHEFDLYELVTAAGDERLGEPVATWARHLDASPEIQQLAAIRKPMVHARLPRRFYRGSGNDKRERTHFDLGAMGSPDAGEVVRLARRVAFETVDALMDDVINGRI